MSYLVKKWNLERVELQSTSFWPEFVLSVGPPNTRQKIAGKEFVKSTTIFCFQFPATLSISIPSER